MLLTMVSVGFVSCGDDKDEPKSADIVGTWQVKAIAEDGESVENLVQFTKDGKWNSVEIYEGEQSCSFIASSTASSLSAGTMSLMSKSFPVALSKLKYVTT